MKREQPWEKALKEANKAWTKEWSEQLDKKAALNRQSEHERFDPMEIHWGSVTPPPPTPSKRGKRKP